jgi:hypothetical protein
MHIIGAKLGKMIKMEVDTDPSPYLLGGAGDEERGVLHEGDIRQRRTGRLNAAWP